MAEAWATVNWPTQKASSAGLRAKQGFPTTKHAQIVLAQHNISWHGTSQLFDTNIVNPTDLLVAMTAEHCQLLQNVLSLPIPTQNASTNRLFPQVIRLDEEKDIADPFGKDLATYRDCFLQIEEALVRNAKTLVE